jgi:hypothetical protein
MQVLMVVVLGGPPADGEAVQDGVAVPGQGGLLEAKQDMMSELAALMTPCTSLEDIALRATTLRESIALRNIAPIQTISMVRIST